MTGGDLLRQAVTLYIEDCARAALPVHGEDAVLGPWQAILGKNEVMKFGSFCNYSW